MNLTRIFQTCTLALFAAALSSCDTTKQTSSNRASANQSQSGTFSFSTNPKVDEILKLTAAIEKRRPQLEREKDRRGKLMLELMSNIGSGCMYDLRVNDIEIIIDGEKLLDLDVSTDKQTNQYLPTATAGSIPFIFQFKGLNDSTQELSFENNESSNPMFLTETHNTFSAPQEQTFKIGSIDLIAIKKKNLAYSVINFGSNKKTIKETDRFRLMSLKIKVNGRPIYTKTNINHIFSEAIKGDENSLSHGLTWEDDYAQLNNEFVALLQTETCPTN